MSGLVRGKIECYFNTFSRNALQQCCFKVTYDYFTSHPNYTLIASNFGATTQVSNSPAGSSGTGTGFYDQPASFGYNAWFVIRSNATAVRPFDVYHMFQWSGAPNQGGVSFGTTPGNPGLINGSTQPIDNNHTFMAYAAAIGIGGTGGSALSPANGNPWKGTTAANGTDTKPTVGPIWGAPTGGGTGVIIWPRSNSNYGAHRAQTQNMGALGSSFSNDANFPNRFHIVGDDDSWVLFNDYGDIGTGFTMGYSGLYTPRNNVTVPYPYVVIDSYNGLPWAVAAESAIYGDIAGTSAQQGGIVTPLSATVVSAVMDHYSLFSQDANFWPDRSVSPPVFNQLDIPVGSFETGGPQDFCGFLGQIDFIREMYNVPQYSVSSDYSRIFIGTTTVNQIKWALPWDKATKTVPRSGQNRNGITFVAPSLNPNA